ncbi:MAG TPA: hypothetical protein PLE40_00395 [Candidatus Pacearchaeota archaeon]|nr:hypothetical protein [Candidatus Pacearchaeota archaeon]
MEIFIIIIVGALAWRGANSLAFSYLNKEFLSLPLFFTTEKGFKIAMMYSYAAIPLALINGFILNSWLGLLIVGLGTWIGMLIANLILRFNPALQFFLFGFINIIWTIYNVQSLF